MFDGPLRVSWLEAAWQEIINRREWPDSYREAIVTVSYPPKNTRKPKGIAYVPAFLHGNWKGNSTEKWYVGVHPASMKNAETAIQALGSIFNVVFSQTELAGIKSALPNFPRGHSDVIEAEPMQTTRLRKYVCPTCHQIIRAATSTLQATCKNCAQDFKLANSKRK